MRLAPLRGTVGEMEPNHLFAVNYYSLQISRTGREERIPFGNFDNEPAANRTYLGND